MNFIKSFATGSPGLPRRGVAALSQALAARVNKISYQVQVNSLEPGSVNTSAGEFQAESIVIATDADVDGMHIRMLLLTFFLQFFPDLVKRNHVYVLQTPLFRVRNKKKTIYCYSDEERRNAILELGKAPEITRFKGLGEISPDEFVHFIGEDIRLEPVLLSKEASIDSILSYFMGKNTQERQDFIIENLRVEKDQAADEGKENTELEVA